MDKLNRYIDQLEKEIENKFYEMSKRMVGLEKQLEYSNKEKEKIKKSLKYLLEQLEKNNE